MECEEDRISSLPDGLIHEILSFADMKCAVQTSVLSKRWKNVWMSLPFISSSKSSFFKIADELDRLSYLENLNMLQKRFMTFFDKVFEFRDDSADIQKIKLVLVMLDDTRKQALNRWIRKAVKHNVQELNINSIYIVNCFLKSAYDEIPHQLLNCRSLKRLCIAFQGVPLGSYIEIILPKSMRLPQIKTLSLEGISISNLDLQRLISSCPLMERLIMKDCDIQTSNTGNIIIESHSLRILTLAENLHMHLGAAHQPLTYTTKISAPNLKEFECKGFMTEDFSLENLSSLVNAEIEMRLREKEADETAQTYSDLPTEEKEVFAKRMLKLLGAVRNVHHLELSSGYLEVLLQAPGTLYRQPPQLCNLKLLKLETRFTSGCFCSIAFLLKISPNITTLELKSKEPNLAKVGDDWETGFSQTCMLSHLKFVEIREVKGCDNELKLLRFLLKRSVVLEKLSLYFDSTGDSPDRERQVTVFERNLRALPTASSNVQMHFLKPCKMTYQAK